MRKITLCGSTKFMDLYHEANLKLTLAGWLVYSVATSVKGDWTPTMKEKAKLDVVHLGKIINSDAILVITDETGYIGESTQREIIYAETVGKSVHWLKESGHRNALVLGWGGKEYL